MTDTPKLADSAAPSSSRQKILSRLREAALISTLLVSVSAPLVAYAISGGETAKPTSAPTPQRVDPLPPRYFAANMFQRVQYEQQTPAAQQTAAASPPSGATRTEKDLLGEKQVPADAYYGVRQKKQ